MSNGFFDQHGTWIPQAGRPLSLLNVARTDLIPEREVWVEITTGPDDLGRVQFGTYFADANQWRGGDGISGQVHFARVDDYSRRMEARGWTIKVRTGDEIKAGLS